MKDCFTKALLLFVFLIQRTLSDSLGFNVHEESKVPSHFRHVGPAPALQSLSLEVILHSRDIKGLEMALYRVSYPASPDYGQYLTKEEVSFCFLFLICLELTTRFNVFQVNYFFQPSKLSQTRVISWLESHGMSPEIHTSTELVIRFTTTVVMGNTLFSANFSEYLNVETGERVIRTTTYSLPESLSPFISHVHPTVA